MTIIRHTVLTAVLGAVVAYSLGFLIFALVGHAHGFGLSLWPTDFLFIMIGLGVLTGGAAGFETGVIETVQRTAAMRRHPASPSRLDEYHASNQWGR